MATLIGSGTTTLATYIPDLADSANIQTALKQLYYGTTAGTLSTTNGIYGALYTLYTGNPTLGGSLTVNGGLSVIGSVTGNTAFSDSIAISKYITVTGNTGSSSIGSGLNLNNLGGSAPVGLNITESTSSTSNRAAIQLGSNWQIGQDLSSNNVKDFYIYNSATLSPVLQISENGGFVPSSNMLVINSDYVAPTFTYSTSGTTGSASYYALSNKSVTLAASTRYHIEMYIKMSYLNTVSSSTGTSSTTLTINAPTSSTFYLDMSFRTGLAAITDESTSLKDQAFSGTSTPSRLANKQTNQGGSGTGYAVYKISGTLVTSTTAGSFGPTIVFSATTSSTGQPSVASGTILAGSYCKVTKLGASGSDFNVGDWA